MYALVIFLFCIYLGVPVGARQLAPYEPQASERALFLQAAAARGDAGLLGFVHRHDAGAWAWAEWGARLEDRSTALHRAAQSPEPLAVRALLALGVPHGALDEMHRTPLHVAARSDRALLATFELLAAGAQVDAVASDGSTPLMEALSHGAFATAVELLHAGADLARTNGLGVSAAMQALKAAPSDKLAAILGATALPRSRFKAYLCDGWREAVGIYRSDFGNLPSFPTHPSPSTASSLFLSNSRDSLLRTYLHIKCPDSTFNSTLSRLAVNASDLFRRTPLHAAALREDVGCVRRLVEAGARAAATDWLNRTALDIARACGNERLQVALLDASADKPTPTTNGDGLPQD